MSIFWLLTTVVGEPRFQAHLTVIPDVGLVLPISIDGANLTAVLNLNYPDVIVPICSPLSTRACLAYSGPVCVGSDQCFDRAWPSWQCKNMQQTQTPSLGMHIVGNVSVKSFEWVSDNLIIDHHALDRIPMKGQVNDLTGRAIFGVGPKRMSCRNETALSALGVEYFALSGEDILFYKSGMGLGAWTEKYMLGSANVSATLGKYAFNAYTPKVCGVDLLGNTSSHWTTIIDSTKKCLVLPSILFNNLAVWRPGSNNILYFGLEEERNGNRFVALDLSKVCVESSKLIDTGITATNPIIIGYQALAMLLKNGAIGFETLPPFRMQFDGTVDKINPTCSVIRTTCIGNQVYHEPGNVCIYPECSSFLFSELDMSSGTCIWRSYVPLAVYTAIAILMVGELLIFALNRKVSSMAQAACEASENQN